MEEKIPCIKCNKKLFIKVRPMLESWGYLIDTVTVIGPWTGFKLLVLNYCNTLGYIAIVPYNELSRLYADRELVTDPEEFLTRAAALKGFEYKPNNNISKTKTMTQIDLRNSKIIETTFVFCRLDNKTYLVDKVGELHGNGVFELKGPDLTVHLEAGTCGNVINIFVNSDDVNRLPNNLLDKSKDFTDISVRNALVLDSGETIPLKEAGRLNDRMQVYAMTGDNHLGTYLVVNNDMIPLFAFSYKGMPVQEFKSESINNIFDLV